MCLLRCTAVSLPHDVVAEEVTEGAHALTDARACVTVATITSSSVLWLDTVYRGPGHCELHVTGPAS